VVQLVYLSAGTWYPIFSSTPVPTFFYRLILFVHTFRALQPLETDHKTPENNFFSSETQATLSVFLGLFVSRQANEIEF
jgi:hypothetical protein